MSNNQTAAFDVQSIANNDVRRIVKEMIHEGHRVAWSGGNHIKAWHKDNVQTYTLSATPSSKNWRTNTAKDLVRSGWLYADPFHSRPRKNESRGTKLGDSSRGDVERQRALRPLVERALSKFEHDIPALAHSLSEYVVEHNLRTSRAKSTETNDLNKLDERNKIVLRKVLRSETVETWALDNMEQWLFSLNYAETVTEALAEPEIVPGTAEPTYDFGSDEPGVMSGFQEPKEDTTEAMVPMIVSEPVTVSGTTTFDKSIEPTTIMEGELLNMIEELEEKLLVRESELDFMRQREKNADKSPYWVRLTETLIDEDISAELLVKIVKDARAQEKTP